MKVWIFFFIYFHDWNSSLSFKWKMSLICCQYYLLYYLLKVYCKNHCFMSKRYWRVTEALPQSLWLWTINGPKCCGFGTSMGLSIVCNSWHQMCLNNFLWEKSCHLAWKRGEEERKGGRILLTLALFNNSKPKKFSSNVFYDVELQKGSALFEKIHKTNLNWN